MNNGENIDNGENINNGETRRDALKRLGLAAIVGGAAMLGVDILASREAKANELPVGIGRDKNLNNAHTKVVDGFNRNIGPRLKAGSFVMSNFRIKLYKSGEDFVIEYFVDLTPVAKTDPRVQDAEKVVGTVERDRNFVSTENQRKKAEWIQDNKGSAISHFWEETAEAEYDGWYHQAILLKAKTM